MDHSAPAIPPHHVATRAALFAAGYSQAEIRRARSQGSLSTLTRGVFADGPTYLQMRAEQRHALRALAAAAAAPRLVVSHTSAAVLHGLPTRNVALKTVHLTRTGAGGGRWGVGSIQHSGPLADAEIVELSGARVTSLSRTITDLARTQSFGSAVCVADHALRTVAGVAVQLKEALNAAHHRPGAGAARRALGFADGRSESPGESWARVLMKVLGVAAPELQCEVFDSGNKFVGRTDLALVDKGVVIEFDGMVKYGDLLRGDLTPQQVLAAEKRREDGLRGLGWLVVRITWSDFDDPGSVTLRLNEAIARGQRVVAGNGLMGSVRLRPPICLPR